MKAGGIKLSKDWDDLIAATDGDKFRARLTKAVTIAADRTGRDFQRLAREAIKRGDYAPNSPISVILKGSSTPLVDRGDLFQGITYQVANPWELRLGVFRAKSGNQTVNVGAVLHEGATINVKLHPKVRMKVFAMMRERLGPERMAALTARSRSSVRAAAKQMGMSTRSKASNRKVMAYLFASGKLIKPGVKGSGIWIIPARPFILRPVMSPAFQAIVLEHYGGAVKAAFGAPNA